MNFISPDCSAESKFSFNSVLNAALHYCALGQIEFGREECHKSKKIFPKIMAIAGR